jgi:type IX secretion system PorP/SprF family membrane protein
LAIGVSAAMDNQRVGVDELYLGIDPDPDSYFDNLLSTGVSMTTANLRTGLLLYSPSFYLGFSYYNLFFSQSQNVDGSFDELYYQGSAQTGFAYPLSALIDIKPSLLILWQSGNQFDIDYNLKLYYQQKIWLGLTYRDTESMVLLAGFSINQLLGFTYSYERSTNSFKQFSDGSHELVLSVRLNKSKRLQPQIW